MPRAAKRLIVALDTPDLASALRLAKRLRGVVRYAKIGSILFTAEGPSAIRRIRALGFDVFLDLKFHDIPSTVEKSCRAAARHGVFLLTVHACGQRDMLKAAVAGASEEARRLRRPRPRIVGVTVLTSVAGGSGRSRLTSRVTQLAVCAKEAGLDGVVASAQEASAIRRRVGSRFWIVCPGIRPADGQALDQARVSSPAAALAAGADWLVVGRPITEARDPRAAALAIVKDMETAR